MFHVFSWKNDLWLIPFWPFLTLKKCIFTFCFPKDKVTKPTIRCETNATDSSNISGLLTCSVAQPDVGYEWLFDGNTQPGQQLGIFLGSKRDARVYSCRVSNPLSNETAEFAAQDCFSGRISSYFSPSFECDVIWLAPLPSDSLRLLLTITELQRLKLGSTFVQVKLLFWLLSYQ